MKISSAIARLFTHKKLDEEIIEQLEEVLILSDVGARVAHEIIENFKKKKFPKSVSENEVKDFLAEEIEKILLPCQKKMEIVEGAKPFVIMLNGVNGSGKTTTIGKLALSLKNQNKKILIAACDTFRAAAVSQLEVVASRAACEIIKPQKESEDPAAVAYRAVSFAKENNFDVVLIDTAGRLQNKQNLMDELKKINSVLKKIDASAPHENILILDATTGQNAKSQLEIFNKIVGITGIIITKLDGSAKAGIVVALASEFSKPIYAIGDGENISNLREFSAKEFAQSLVNL